MEREYLSDTYQFMIPLVKSNSQGGKRILEGIASTESWDAQDEQVLQDGVNFHPFLQGGFINWNHSGNPQGIIGVPLEGGIITHQGLPAFWIKARLFDDIPTADYAWQIIKALEQLNDEEGLSRHLGWSVEGAVLEQENGRIKRSIIRHVALTHEPVNTDTYVVAKSFSQFAKSFGPITTPNVSSPNGQGEFDPTRREDLDTGKTPKECEGKTGDDLADCLRGITDTNLKRSMDGTLFERFFGAPKGKIFKSWDDMMLHMICVKNIPPDDALDFVRRIRKTASM